MKASLLKKLGRVKTVPTDWILTTVGNVCSVRNDLRKPLSTEERAKIQGPYPYYGPTGILDFIDHHLAEGKFALIGEDGDHFLKPNQKAQTILVNGKFNVNNHAHIIEGTDDCTSEWFFIYFHHRDITHLISRQGASRYKLNKATLNKLPILVPPIKEQLEIYKLLTTWDSAIEKTEALITLKKQIRNSSANRLLFGQDRVLDKKRGSKYQNAKWFNVPHDWSITKIQDVAREVVERNSCESKYTVLSCSKYIGFVESLKYFKKKVYSDNTENYKIIRLGEFGYPSNHIEEGSIGLQNLCDTGIVSPIYTVFRVNDDQINSDYLYKLLKTDIYRHIFQASTSSSVDRRGSLRWKEFSKIEIPLPDINEQNKIANTINSFDREIHLLKELLEKYRLQKRALMQKLLTGEWQIRDISEVSEETAKEMIA
ncbi:restriction endonuclease subunit S [Marinomonas primoryensis]|uniref:restriction endonuclease subunit S n=1 Tax=Marinomonas primoryensis TaxID=178399 RepID=UPI000DD2DA61|nr:restriction endonuclease subunit S [Marinomonas primoryensis]